MIISKCEQLCNIYLTWRSDFHIYNFDESTKFIIEFRQVGGCLVVVRVSSIKYTDRHNIAEILLKVVLNTNTP